MVAMQSNAGASLSFLKDRMLYHNDELCGRARPRTSTRSSTGSPPGSRPGSRGLLFTPWLHGERTPVSDPCLRAGLFNLCSSTPARTSCARSSRAWRSIPAGCVRPVERFLGRPLREITIAGGGGVSDTWCQIFADVLNVPVRQLAEPMQANARGAAGIGAVGLGLLHFAAGRPAGQGPSGLPAAPAQPRRLRSRLRDLRRDPPAGATALPAAERGPGRMTPSAHDPPAGRSSTPACASRTAASSRARAATSRCASGEGLFAVTPSGIDYYSMSAGRHLRAADRHARRRRGRACGPRWSAGCTRRSCVPARRGGQSFTPTSRWPARWRCCTGRSRCRATRPRAARWGGDRDGRLRALGHRAAGAGAAAGAFGKHQRLPAAEPRPVCCGATMAGAPSRRSSSPSGPPPLPRGREPARADSKLHDLARAGLALTGRDSMTDSRLRHLPVARHRRALRAPGRAARAPAPPHSRRDRCRRCCATSTTAARLAAPGRPKRRRVIPGGVQHNLAFNHPFPLAINRAEAPTCGTSTATATSTSSRPAGRRCWDRTTRRCATRSSSSSSTAARSPGLFHEYEYKLAELVRQHMPAVEMFRMLGSGTEAVMAAVRLARAFTGKKWIIKIGGALPRLERPAGLWLAAARHRPARSHRHSPRLPRARHAGVLPQRSGRPAPQAAAQPAQRRHGGGAARAGRPRERHPPGPPRLQRQVRDSCATSSARS